MSLIRQASRDELLDILAKQEHVVIRNNVTIGKCSDSWRAYWDGIAVTADGRKFGEQEPIGTLNDCRCLSFQEALSRAMLTGQEK